MNTASRNLIPYWGRVGFPVCRVSVCVFPWSADKPTLQKQQEGHLKKIAIV